MERGFRLDIAPVDATRARHRFCGEADPPFRASCPECGRLALHLLTIDATDPALALASQLARIPLLFCWKCSLSQRVSSYRVDRRAISYLDPGDRTSPEDLSNFPYADYPLVFPEGWAHLRPLGDREVYCFRTLREDIPVDAVPATFLDELRALSPGLDAFMRSDAFDGTVPSDFTDALRYEHISLDLGGHQIGGVPYTNQGVRELACPTCGRSMPLLACLADETLDARGFTGNSCVQVLYHACHECGVVSAYQEV